MEYMIVHRGKEIYRLRFTHEADGVYLLTEEPIIFYAVHGWPADRVMAWLEQRNFESYWERDND